MDSLINKTKIKYHKGTHTIGGTFIEITYKDSRIFFDLGSMMDITEDDKSFKNLHNKSSIAHVEGIYDPVLLENAGIKEGVNKYKSQAGFISHAHLDHTSILNFIDPALDIYTSFDTKSVIESGNVKGDKLIPFNDSQLRHYKYNTFTRPIKGVNPLEEIEVGDIKVLFIPVDHDAYGACGMIISTPDLKIAYTADIRLHGYRKDDSLKFIKAARGSDILISEGVSLSFFRLGEDEELKSSEAHCLEDITTVVKDNPDRNISFNFYEYNIERILNLIESISPYREVVLTDYAAYILKNVVDKEVKYYKTTGTDLDLSPSLKINREEIEKDNEKFFWNINPYSLYMADSIKNGIYIHTDGQPVGDFDPTYRPYMETFIKNGFEIKIISSNGHASTKDLSYIIEEISPRVLTPLHSFHPENVYFSGKKIVPKDGYELLID